MPKKVRRRRKALPIARREHGSGRYPTNPLPPQHQKKPGRESRMKPRPHFSAPHYNAAGKLAGNTALITGGDSGIGRAVAVLFAREGADIAFTHLPQEAADAAHPDEDEEEEEEAPARSSRGGRATATAVAKRRR